MSAETAELSAERAELSAESETIKFKVCVMRSDDVVSTSNRLDFLAGDILISVGFAQCIKVTTDKFVTVHCCHVVCVWEANI